MAFCHTPNTLFFISRTDKMVLDFFDSKGTKALRHFVSLFNSFFLVFQGCMNTDAMEDLDLQPLIDMLLDYDFTVPMVDNDVSATNMNITHVVV